MGRLHIAPLGRGTYQTILEELEKKVDGLSLIDELKAEIDKGKISSNNHLARTINYTFGKMKFYKEGTKLYTITPKQVEKLISLMYGIEYTRLPIKKSQ